MMKNKINYWIVIATTLIAAGIVHIVVSADAIENKMFYKFPLIIGTWRGTDISMESYVYKSLETPYVFLRNYSSPSYEYPLNLSIVWFDDRNMAFHAPEACLGGVGNTVNEKGTVNIRLDKDYVIGKLKVEFNNNHQLVLYFFDVDGFITTSQSQIRLRVLMNRMQFKRTSAAFIRIMAPILISEEETMRAELDFLKVIYPLLPEYTYTERVMGMNR
jgi:EpsI family protein